MCSLPHGFGMTSPDFIAPRLYRAKQVPVLERAGGEAGFVEPQAEAGSSGITRRPDAASSCGTSSNSPNAHGMCSTYRPFGAAASA